MSKKYDGGSAFPHEPFGQYEPVSTGMSLRVWYAGMAMQAIIQGRNGPSTIQDCERAFLWADKMLEVQNK